MDLLDFYKGKRVLITGHTGFKGSWLTRILTLAGAEVTGYSLEPAEDPALFHLLRLGETMDHRRGDIRDPEHFMKVFEETRPEIVFHLAAQPIVRDSYRDPVYTYETNVMGTVHVLECIRRSPYVRSFVNVTTDKVYENREWEYGYRETDRLDGYDPYSNSKSCSELVTHSYRQSFLDKQGCAVSTCRAGNVIGGGDFAPNRILPDCIRAVQNGQSIHLRNPNSVRPYQHVLEPLSAYLLISQRQYEDAGYADCYNIGPDSKDCLTTGELAGLFCRAWGGEARWEHTGDLGPHEDALLSLDCSKITARLGWKPKWDAGRAVSETVAWTKQWLNGQDMSAYMERQIKIFLADT